MGASGRPSDARPALTEIPRDPQPVRVQLPKLPQLEAAQIGPSAKERRDRGVAKNPLLSKLRRGHGLEIVRQFLHTDILPPDGLLETAPCVPYEPTDSSDHRGAGRSGARREASNVAIETQGWSSGSTVLSSAQFDAHA